MPDPRHALQQAAGTLGLQLHSSATDQLLSYLSLLQKWNQVYNLTAVRDPDAMLSHHLYDCMAVVPAVRQKLELADESIPGSSRIRVLDVGSGAGLPGVVLAICQPRLQVCCIDAVAKKVAFLRQVKAQLGLSNLQPTHGRVEHLSTQQPDAKFQLITARAFSSLAAFVEMTMPLIAEDGMWMAMKARDADQEVAQLPSSVDVFHVEQLDVPSLDAARCLIWMRPHK